MTSIHYTSHPVTALRGEIAVPGDKSISHRSIMFGAIANGITTVEDFLEGEDCLATIRAFREMGVCIEGPEAKQVVIHGVGKYGLKKPDAIMDCGNSGTSIRLLSGLLAAQPFDTRLTGDASLRARPMNRVARPLMQMGAKIETTNGCPPLTIYGGQKLHGITYDMPQASAQVKSCLLLAGMYAEGDTTIIEPDISRDHTERMLATMGYPVKRVGNAMTIDSRRECSGVAIKVPGDLSSAAFFIVAATIIPASCLTIRNVGMNPTRTGVIELLTQMGASICVANQRFYGEEPVADLTIRSALLTGIDIPPHLVSLAIDEFPILFVAAACAKGKTVLRGAEELRCKESDRIGAMAEGLVRLGIDAAPTDDGIVIHGGVLTGGMVDSHHDHRIAMAFSIAGAAATSPVSIRNCNNVSTSFPNFLAVAYQCGLAVKPRKSS